MIAAMVMDTMVILMATAMVTMIVIIVVQGVTPVIGDRIEGRGKASHLMRPSPGSGHSHPDDVDDSVPAPLKISALLPPCKARLRAGRRSPCRERIDAFPVVLTSFDPWTNK
jgi:hypothetical protein